MRQAPGMDDDLSDLLEAARRGETGWFERLYAAADGDPTRVPWAMQSGHHYLTAWLRTADGEDRSACVVGCGLGDDAEALAAAGFDVTAFDLSPRAISWARSRFPDSPVRYEVGDLFEVAQERPEAFDLVWESRTVQSLPPERHADAAAAVGRLVSDHGMLLAITLLAVGPNDWVGPPWPVEPHALDGYVGVGLSETDRVEIVEIASGVVEVALHYRRVLAC